MQTIFTEGFETDGNGTRYITSIPEFTDNSSDFFIRTDFSDVSGGYRVTGLDGSFVFAAQDIDGEGAASQQTLTFTDIDISGFTDLAFSALFAEDDDGSNEDWDLPDFFQVDVRIDGGGFQPIFAIQSIPDGDSFNAVPAVDTDFDGEGDGTVVTDTFQRLGNAVAGTGSTLDLRLTFDLNSGDEDLAVDGIEITGTAPSDVVVLNEILGSTSGTDTEFVELAGTPGASLDGLSLIFVDGDVGQAGTLDGGGAITFGPGDALGANGRFLIANAQFATTFPDIAPDLSVANDFIENSSYTAALVETASLGADPTTATAIDAVGVTDGGAEDEFFFDAPVVGPDGTFLPSGVVRVPEVTGDFEDSDSFATFATTTTPTAATPFVAGTQIAIIATDADKVEGDAGTTDFTFTVTRSGDVSEAGTVDFAVTGAGANPADGADFGGTLPSGMLMFAAGDDTMVVTLSVSGDTTEEADEGFAITLSNPSGDQTIATASASGTIVNDDNPAATPVSAVQGPGRASPLAGSTVVVDAIVVGDFQDGGLGADGDLNGFYLQEEDADADADAATSEGIFVFDGFSPGVDVEAGDRVQVVGEVTEFFGETQIDATSVTVVSENNPLPAAAVVDLPTTGTVANADGELIADLEAFEGMRITLPDTLTVSEYFNYDRFGEIRLTLVEDGERQFQFTQTNAPSIPGFAAFLDDLASRTVTVDDGTTAQNPDTLPFPAPGFSNENFFRGGDTVTDLTGVVRFGRGSGGSGDETYRINPTVDPVFNEVNPRPESAPDVGGDLTVASFNVLNYFATLDQGANGSGPNNLNPRGADNQGELDRQTEKLVTTILKLDADILGLIELENDFAEGSPGNAVELLVDELNAVAGAGTYDWVRPGRDFVDTGDAISSGFIYQPATVRIAPGTMPAILDDATLPAGFEGERIFDGVATNRAVLAVTFEEVATGEDVTIAVNHFKSKNPNSITGPENADIGDGQAGSNPIRVLAAEALEAWLDTNPTGSDDPDQMIIGDLNAYAQEDPIVFLEDQGFTDLAEEFVGDDAYSFLFDGQFGTLDYGLANPSLLSQVTGAAEWHVNSDEADALDYDTTFKDPAVAALFDGTDPFRNSDHDPLLIGLDLGAPAVNVVAGTGDSDRLEGTDGPDRLVSEGGARDLLTGGAEADLFDFSGIANNGTRDRAAITDFEPGLDGFVFDDGAEVSVVAFNGNTTILLGDDPDLIRVAGVELTEADLFPVV